MNNMEIEPHEIRQKGLENLILLVLGAGDNRTSVLHLQKEMFLLWNFHPIMKEYLNFIKHYRGPFSSEIDKIIYHPFYLDNCWVYEHPKKNDSLSGGYVKLTEKGNYEYNRLYKEAKTNESLLTLLTGISMVHELYDKLSLEELLLLIYDTYPEYTENSNVFSKVRKRGKVLAKKLLDKGMIDEGRFNSLSNGT